MKKWPAAFGLVALLTLNGCGNEFESGLLLGAGVTAVIATGALLHNSPEERPSPTLYAVPYSTYRNPAALRVTPPVSVNTAQATPRPRRYLSPIVAESITVEATPPPILSATEISGLEHWDWETEDEAQSRDEAPPVAQPETPEPAPSSSPTPIPVIIIEPATTQDALRLGPLP